MTIYNQTPLLQSHRLKAEKDLNVFYKMECYQPVGSFKIRGMEHLCRHYLAKGQNKFIASSGGNAGLAMAYVAKKLGANIKIIVPKTTSEFMIQFYKNWQTQKMEIRDAFKNAQLQMRDKYEDPEMWAGFVLIE